MFQKRCVPSYLHLLLVGAPLPGVDFATISTVYLLPQFFFLVDVCNPRLSHAQPEQPAASSLCVGGVTPVSFFSVFRRLVLVGS